MTTEIKLSSQELYSIIQQFRATELQDLLRYARQSPYAGKAVLLDRCQKLVAEDPGKYTAKVIEVYRRQNQPAADAVVQRAMARAAQVAKQSNKMPSWSWSSNDYPLTARNMLASRAYTQQPSTSTVSSPRRRSDQSTTPSSLSNHPFVTNPFSGYVSGQSSSYAQTSQTQPRIVRANNYAPATSAAAALVKNYPPSTSQHPYPQPTSHQQSIPAPPQLVRGIPQQQQQQQQPVPAQLQVYADRTRRTVTGAGGRRSPGGGMVPADPAGPVVAANQPIPVHPPVSLFRLPFFDQKAELIKPTTLAARSAQKFQDEKFSFALTPSQVREISYPPSMALPRSEVQLRFALIDIKSVQKDDFPSSCVVRLNEHNVTLPNPIPSTKPGVEPKRPGRPVDLTPHCQRTDLKPQRLSVTWAADGIRNWVVTVNFVQRLDSNVLLQRLTAKVPSAAEHTIALIKDKLAGSDADNEITMTSLRAQLMCPLMKTRINYPCRTRDCQHVQCFDAFNFLLMNEKRPTWLCPVCDKDGHYDKLVIDGYSVHVLGVTSSEVTDVELNPDGSWTPLIRDDDADKLIPQGEPRYVPLSAIPIVSPRSTKPAVPRRPASPPKPQCSSDPPVVDLTEDSDEEPAPTPYSVLSAALIASPPSVASQSSSVCALDSPAANRPPSARNPTIPTPEDPVAMLPAAYAAVRKRPAEPNTVIAQQLAQRPRYAPVSMPAYTAAPANYVDQKTAYALNLQQQQQQQHQQQQWEQHRQKYLQQQQFMQMQANMQQQQQAAAPRAYRPPLYEAPGGPSGYSAPPSYTMNDFPPYGVHAAALVDSQVRHDLDEFLQRCRSNPGSNAGL